MMFFIACFLAIIKMKTYKFNILQINTKEKFRQTDGDKGFNRNVVISLFLVATPFLFYLYKLASNGFKICETLLFTIINSEWKSIQRFFYHVWIRITMMTSFSIWFFTYKHWWRYALLISFTIYLYQLTGVLNHNIQYFNTYEFYNSLSIIIPLFLVHVMAVLTIQNKTNKLDLNQQLIAGCKSALNDYTF